MIKLLCVGMGGFAGSICRYLVNLWAQHSFTTPFFPYGTLAVNIAGCLLIGFLGGLSETKHLFTPELRALVFIGFLGGFTTYSTFGYEIFNLARDGQMIPALVNLMLHLVLGFAAVWFGFSISRLI